MQITFQLVIVTNSTAHRLLMIAGKIKLRIKYPEHEFTDISSLVAEKMSQP